jgi:precorrin-2 methylase
LDLYKIDNGLTPSDKKNKRKAAASVVNKGSKTQVDAEELADTIRESDIEKMSDAQYAANAEKINAAIRSGKMIYDLSGNRR